MPIISFSLWGNNERYTQGAIANGQLAKLVYPGWDCWFWVGADVSDEIRTVLEGLGRVLEMPPGNWTSMFWRFYPAAYTEPVIVRDTDSRLSFRERMAVDEWLKSNKDFHIMRDHPYHATPILGGMWGARNGILPDIHKQTMGFTDNRWQIDQEFLADIVYPIVESRSCVHDEFYERKPFPNSRRDSRFFVGQAYDGSGKILDADGNFADYFKEEHDYFRKCNGEG